VLCQEPCILALVACLLPPAVVACYICCCCSPCENQARGRSGSGGHPGEDSEQSVPPFQFDHSFGDHPGEDSEQSVRFSLIARSANQPHLHVAKIPIGVATNGCDEWGDAYARCTLWLFFSWFSSISNLGWTLHSCNERHTLAATSSICDDNAGKKMSKNPIFTNLKKRFEHIELPAKILDYFLRSNKSNINQCESRHTANPPKPMRMHTKILIWTKLLQAFWSALRELMFERAQVSFGFANKSKFWKKVTTYSNTLFKFVRVLHF